MIASLGRTALAAVAPRKKAAVATPGEIFEQTIAVRPRELVRDYIREVGGDPRAYRGQLPPHLFPQWGFPLAAKTLRNVPYPLARVLNGGCRLEINGRLPDDQPLTVRAHLESVDDNGRRAVLVQRVTTGTAADPELVVATLFAIVPLAKRAPGEPREHPRVPADADEIAYWKLRADAGLSFAILTGDFNPVHWSRRYARSFGFRSTILHGFATMARAFEGIAANRFAGDVAALAEFDVKFTRPLLLPAQVGLYIKDRSLFVGSAPGGPAFMTGTFRRNDDE